MHIQQTQSGSAPYKWRILKYNLPERKHTAKIAQSLKLGKNFLHYDTKGKGWSRKNKWITVRYCIMRNTVKLFCFGLNILLCTYTNLDRIRQSLNVVFRCNPKTHKMYKDATNIALHTMLQQVLFNKQENTNKYCTKARRWISSERLPKQI